jgi:hypothetical protein
MRPFELVPFLALVRITVDGVDVEVVPLELIIFLVVVDQVGDELLLVVAPLVDGVLGEVGLNNVKLAHVPHTAAVFAKALLMMSEVGLG